MVLGTTEANNTVNKPKSFETEKEVTRSVLVDLRRRKGKDLPLDLSWVLGDE